jgi:L-malate glycosyltransferase
LKTKLARRVDWWFAYTERSLPPILEAGFPLERVTCLNNTVDVQEMLTWRQGIADGERRALLSALDLNGARVGVFLGGLIPEKRVRFLCKTADLLKHRFPDFELFVIGDGPNRGEILDFAASRPWVRWVGPRHGRDKIIHVSLGHVMLNPGMVGLGIFDGFACGVPMVTTDCGIHSPEIAYLESGRNGLMTADRLEDFVEGAAKLLEDEGLRTRLAAQGQQDARKYTLDKMVDCFAEGILKAMDAPPLAHDGHWRT